MTAFLGDCVCGKPGGQWLVHECPRFPRREHRWHAVWTTQGGGTDQPAAERPVMSFICTDCGEVGYPIRAAS